MSNPAPPANDSISNHLSNLKSPTPSPQISPEAALKSKWKPGSSNYLDGLRALPEVRSIPWAPGKELPPDKSTESSRIQTRGAFLLSTRGKINDPPCTHCASGVGRFLHCVSLGNWFHGACSTCQMGTRGNLCSLRTQDGKIASPSVSIKQTSPSTRDTSPRKTQPIQSTQLPPSAKRKRESLSNDPRPPNPPSPIPQSNRPTSTIPPPQSSNIPTINERIASIPQPQASKISTNKAQSTSQLKPNQVTLSSGHAHISRYSPQYAGPNPPSIPHHSQALSYTQYPPYVSHQGNSHVPYYNYNDPASNMINYIYKTPTHLNDKTPPQISYQAPLPAHPPAVPQALAQTPRHAPQNATQKPPKGGSILWKQPPPLTAAPKSKITPADTEREDSGSLSPSEQLLGSDQDISNAVNNGAAQAPTFLDSIPKKTQKQIRELVKSLQSGIVSAKQQAENMQQQLEQLRAALGVSGDLDTVD